jgi:type II secretory pathway pseudopilin PulG
MVEIALCLAIIGFALVAIVGILPIGMAVQRDNREETLINQDANYLLEAIRGGAQGVDMLTNYVEYITVTRSNMVASATPSTTLYSNIWLTPISIPAGYPPPQPLVSGAQVIGLLSIPKYEGTTSNYVVAVMRAISGPATEKGINASSRDFAFHYRVVSEVVPAGLPALARFNWDIANSTVEQRAQVTNQYDVLRTIATNLHEIRLLFRWPVRPNGTIGGGKQTYRALAGGSLVSSNAGYFLQPANYRKAN